MFEVGVDPTARTAPTLFGSSITMQCPPPSIQNYAIDRCQAMARLGELGRVEGAGGGGGGVLDHQCAAERKRPDSKGMPLSSSQ